MAHEGDEGEPEGGAGKRWSARPPAPRPFVLGATGYVGREVVRQLAARETVGDVTAHVRPESPRAQLFADAGERVRVSRAALTVPDLGSALSEARASHVFLCHGTTAKRARAEGIEDPYETIDVGLVRLACEAARRAGLEPRFVHLSSVGADPKSRSPYLSARGRAEEVLRSSGMPFTICRAPLLTGTDRDERRPLETLGRVALDPLLRVAGAVGLGRLRDRYLSMDASEAAEGLIESGFHYQTIGRVVRSDELRRVGVYERETWTPASRRDTDRH